VTFNADPDAVARAVTPRTRAIVPVHLYGLCANMDAILDVAAHARVPVIEDAAQAIGARIGTRQAGSMGTVGCFSFFPSKNLGAFGDGGLVTTNEAALAAEMRLLRNHGAEPKYYHSRIGGNFRLDALQAAVLRVKAPHLAGWTAARRVNADRYRALFAEFGLLDTVTLPVEPDGYTHIYNQFVIRAPRRDALRDHLTANRIGTEIYYPVPFHRQQCFQFVVRPGDEYPEADRAAEAVLALPIYGELTPDQQRHVVATIAAFYRA
jgi:dTDP-4-amino-4,6-dideoxygalactose transaminase